MAFRISKPSVKVNNNPIAIIPNSAKFDEGEGETSVSAISIGGGGVELVVSDDATDKVGMVSFEIPNTPANIDLARGWKKNPGDNVVEVDGKTKDGKKFNRVFNQASVVNNYEVELGVEGKISLDWKSQPPI